MTIENNTAVRGGCRGKCMQVSKAYTHRLGTPFNERLRSRQFCRLYGRVHRHKHTRHFSGFVPAVCCCTSPYPSAEARQNRLSLSLFLYHRFLPYTSRSRKRLTVRQYSGTYLSPRNCCTFCCVCDRSQRNMFFEINSF